MDTLDRTPPPTAEEIRAAFDRVTDLTIGIEEEVLLVDAATGEPAPRADEVIEAPRRGRGGWLRSEARAGGGPARADDRSLVIGNRGELTASSVDGRGSPGRSRRTSRPSGPGRHRSDRRRRRCTTRAAIPVSMRPMALRRAASSSARSRSTWRSAAPTARSPSTTLCAATCPRSPPSRPTHPSTPARTRALPPCARRSARCCRARACRRSSRAGTSSPRRCGGWTC